MNRRHFIAGLLATTAPLPALAPLPPVTMRYTGYGRLTLAEMRAALLPGLMEIHYKFENRWENVFKSTLALDELFEEFDEKEKS